MPQSGWPSRARDVEAPVLAERRVGHTRFIESSACAGISTLRAATISPTATNQSSERNGYVGTNGIVANGGATPRLRPMSRLTRADVEHVATLARLALTDDEIEHFTAQLEVILEHAAQIAALDTNDVPPTAHPLPVVNVLRADEVRPSLPRDEVLAMAPAVGRRPVPRPAHPRRTVSASDTALELAAAVRGGAALRPRGRRRAPRRHRRPATASCTRATS